MPELPLDRDFARWGRQTACLRSVDGAPSGSRWPASRSGRSAAGASGTARPRPGRRANASPADHNLLEIAHCVPEGTFCLITALARHGLTDVIPDRVDVAVPRGKRIPALQSPVNIHAFVKDTFDLGRGMVKVGDGLTLELYSAERSLVDMIRLRHREGAKIAWEALRRWLRRKGARPAALIEMARSFRGAESAVRHALEVVL